MKVMGITKSEFDAWTRSVRVTRDIVFFFHQQSEYNSIMDDLDYGFFCEKYWTALVDTSEPLDLEIERGCLALLYAMGTCEAGNVAGALGDSLQECRETLNQFQPKDPDTEKLKKIAELALSYAAIPNDRRDFNAVENILGNGGWIHKLVVRPYFKSRSKYKKLRH